MPWATLLVSVGLYIVIPVILAPAFRAGRRARAGCTGSNTGTHRPGLSIAALLLTLVLLFAFQGEAIIRSRAGDAAGGADPDPGVLQFRSGVLAQPPAGEKHLRRGPSMLIGASNFFELAVAAAISLFGFIPAQHSQQWSACSSSWLALLVVRGQSLTRAGTNAARPLRNLQETSMSTITIYHNPACGTRATCWA